MTTNPTQKTLEKVKFSLLVSCLGCDNHHTNQLLAHKLVDEQPSGDCRKAVWRCSGASSDSATGNSRAAFPNSADPRFQW
ncbi:hypothetical protein K443DRAFT_684109 [Laccaria amethystina LaAM-08-1]|uniref:Uncharacterized protein n=1 Tax=Laccaria amethystina LaAM-08-1 TaxID=1095629 RepID=A0A0C9WYI4_9AGAR|nr:hypothetical protein K443DRAFT_684109 [Laccaria amethystina LaAM-08-1]